MARVGQSVQMQTSSDLNACAAAAMATLKSNGCKPKQKGPLLVAAKTGSQLWTRVLGGLFTDGKRFPCRIVISLVDAGQSRQISITAEERLGWAIIGGMKGKYEQRCALLVQQTFSGLQASLEPIHQDLQQVPSMSRSFGS